MIHFITGRCGTGKSTAVLAEMQRTLRETDRDVVLIVPEQQTVVWETRIAEEIPEHWALRVEVTNFTRLANAVFRTYGGLAVNRCDDGGRALILWRAMLSVWDGLSVYNRGVDGREDKNLPSLMAAIGELKQNGVTPLQLEQAAYELEQRDGESELTRRLSDLSLVFAAYEELLHEEYCDKHDIMNALCQILEGAGRGYFQGKVCFADSFFSLTMHQKRILRAIMTEAADVTVTFSCDGDGGGEIQFGEVRAYYDSMVRMAGEILDGRAEELKITKLKKDLRHEEGSPLFDVERGLFGRGGIEQKNEEDTPSPADHIRVIQCADRYEEAEACATLIEKMVREGCRYSDIGVVARNMSSRCGIVDTALRRHGIPCFISERSALSEDPAIRLLSTLLDIQSNGWQRKDVIRLIKTGLTPLQDYECDLLEEYTATWNIRGRRFFAEEEAWTMNPDGYRKEMSQWGAEILSIVNSAREKLFPAVLTFCRLFDEREGIAKNHAPVCEIAAGMVSFALAMGLYESLERRSAALMAEGRLREAEQTRQVWKAICTALDKLVMVLGDTPLDAGRFGGLFAYVCASMDIGTIPTAMDEVVLGSSDGVRFSEVEHMIILGSVEGEFPGAAEDNGFFCDADKLKLSGVGINLSNDTLLKTAQEYFMYYRTACLARKSLTVLVPRSDGEMSGGAAGLYAMFGKEILTSYGDLPLCERMYHPSSADYAVSYETGAAREGLERLAGERNRLNVYGTMGLSVTDERLDKRTLDKLFGSRMSLSQSRIDTYVKCPFSYWCRYVMNLKEGAKAEISTPDIGVFVHEVMERFFSETADMTYPLSYEETERIADGIIRDYVMALDSGRMNGRLRYLFIRLRRNVLCFLESIMEELSESEFKPIAFELPIGIDVDGKVSLDAVSFRLEDGSELALKGIADRVDLYKNRETGRAYIRVVDYKTGAKTFSMEDVQLGLNVQLLLYLFSVWKGRHTALTGETEVYPAGAVYISARPGDITSDKMLSREEARELVKSRIERSGLFLADEAVLDAMDRSGTFVTASMKGGKGSAAKNLVSLEEFGRLYTDLEQTIAKIGTEIKAGNAAASPLIRNGKSPCDYCSHYPICRMDAAQTKG